MFYGNPVVNKNMKKKAPQFPTPCHGGTYFLVVLLVAGYSVIWLPSRKLSTPNKRLSRQGGGEFPCHGAIVGVSMNFLGKSLELSMGVFGSKNLTFLGRQILGLWTNTPNWNTPQATCNQDARKKASLSFLANGGLPELCFGGVPWFYVIFINRWVWRIADRISYSKHESYQSI